MLYIWTDQTFQAKMMAYAELYCKNRQVSDDVTGKIYG